MSDRVVCFWFKRNKRSRRKERPGEQETAGKMSWTRQTRRKIKERRLRRMRQNEGPSLKGR